MTSVEAQLLGFAVFFLLVGVRRWYRRRRINRAIDAWFEHPRGFDAPQDQNEE